MPVPVTSTPLIRTTSAKTIEDEGETEPAKLPTAYETNEAVELPAEVP